MKPDLRLVANDDNPSPELAGAAYLASIVISAIIGVVVLWGWALVWTIIEEVMR